jgi:hypothetical protein
LRPESARFQGFEEVTWALVLRTRAEYVLSEPHLIIDSAHPVAENLATASEYIETADSSTQNAVIA